eukprot:9977955-Ditylum_brightwellii.AAC.1
MSSRCIKQMVNAVKVVKAESDDLHLDPSLCTRLGNYSRCVGDESLEDHLARHNTRTTSNAAI